jgi:hypothetical protein
MKTIKPIFWNNSNVRRWWFEVGFDVPIKIMNTPQCLRCNVVLYRPYDNVKQQFLPVTKTHCPQCEEYLALVAVAEAAKAIITPHKGGRYAGELQREQNELRVKLEVLDSIRAEAKSQVREQLPKAKFYN